MGDSFMHSSSEKKSICVVGGGRWGQNHIKTLFKMGCLAGIVESDGQRLNKLLVKYPANGYATLDGALIDGFDGFVVATPAETHYVIGKRIIDNGYHVLIEKPMALYSGDAAELVELADRKSVNLMVGHVLLFHPAIVKIKELVDSGKIGQLYYLYSTRLNLGTVRTEENVFWSFAPHDISVLNYIVGKPSISVHATGGKYLQRDIDDFVMAHFQYPDNIKAHIFVSWLHPFKEQRLVVIGSKGMISFDDSSEVKDIYFYDKGINFENGIPNKMEKPDEIISYSRSQPLDNELRYFIDNIDKKIEIADGRSGLEVVRVLENVQEFL